MARENNFENDNDDDAMDNTMKRKFPDNILAAAGLKRPHKRDDAGSSSIPIDEAIIE
ncbi:unnamed protein product, partial [Rotaria sp. Silwood2]